ncbi:TPA: NAD-dependent malic enzyme, partial [Candidatus Micrarchaeota archaeon]|nr:NAD-dependent malic enzyme [Candidatus Micrarchaeota archaeon]
DIPVFHDDQHGTAIVVLAGLYNALKIAGKGTEARTLIVGAGSAGYGIAKLLHAAGFRNLIVFDSRGAIHKGREGLSGQKEELASFTNPEGYSGKLADFKGADVIISAASPGSLPLETVKAMSKPSIVFALANPISEISLEQAKELQIDVFGTGRSDYPNQINNSLCFPGFLRALLDFRVRRITDAMKIAAAKGIAETVTAQDLEEGRIVPDTFDRRVSDNIKKKVSDSIEE